MRTFLLSTGRSRDNSVCHRNSIARPFLPALLSLTCFWYGRRTRLPETRYWQRRKLEARYSAHALSSIDLLRIPGSSCYWATIYSTLGAIRFLWTIIYWSEVIEIRRAHNPSVIMVQDVRYRWLYRNSSTYLAADSGQSWPRKDRRWGSYGRSGVSQRHMLTGHRTEVLLPRVSKALRSLHLLSHKRLCACRPETFLKNLDDNQSLLTFWCSVDSRIAISSIYRLISNQFDTIRFSSCESSQSYSRRGHVWRVFMPGRSGHLFWSCDRSWD